jgi:hypothetical protein
MKSLISILFAFTAIAAPVTLVWDPVIDPSVTGYRLYFGPGTRAYTNSVSVPGQLNTTNTISNLPAGIYFFAVTSVAGALESDFSNEVTWTNKPPVPGALRIVWSGSTNSSGLVTPIASVNPGPSFTVNATMTGPWGSVNRSGSTDSAGYFSFKGRPATRPFIASATVTKLSFDPLISSSQMFD